VVLAGLYEVEPRVLVQAVKRNLERFPEDFMFQLTKRESENLKSQFVISSSAWGGARRAMPYAFTEQGVAMLSSVLGSQRAIQVNVAIMRAFVKLRESMTAHTELAHRIEALERLYGQHDEDIQAVFGAIRSLLESPADSVKRSIGFKIEAPASN
jgi:ORF6N domain